VGEQPGVNPGDVQVIGLDGQQRQHALDERSPALTPPAFSELHANEKLGRRNRRDRDVVVVGNDLVQGRGGPLGGD